MKSSSLSSINKGYYIDHINIHDHSSSHYSLPASTSSNRATFTRMGIALYHKFGRAFNSYNYKIYGIRLDGGRSMSDYKAELTDITMHSFRRIRNRDRTRSF